MRVSERKNYPDQISRSDKTADLMMLRNGLTDCAKNVPSSFLFVIAVSGSTIQAGKGKDFEKKMVELRHTY